MKVENTNRFEPTDGGTLSIQHLGVVGGFFKIAGGLAIKQVQKTIETDAKTLKKLLEAK